RTTSSLGERRPRLTVAAASFLTIALVVAQAADTTLSQNTARSAHARLRGNGDRVRKPQPGETPTPAGHGCDSQSRAPKLPMSFEPNEGQTSGEVKFLARGRGYTLFLTSTEAVLSLRASSRAVLTPHP